MPLLYCSHAERSAAHCQANPLQRSSTMSASLRSVDGQDETTILREIQSALRDLRFGAVEITVHNAQVVQIERKEKFRLQQPGNKPS